jgi:hypothetical protein
MSLLNYCSMSDNYTSSQQTSVIRDDSGYQGQVFVNWYTTACLCKYLQRVRKGSLSPAPIAGTPHLGDNSINTASV